MPSSQNTQEQGSSKPSSGKTNSNTNTNTQMSFNQMVKNAGFSNFNEFMLSYGLKMYNDDDVQEAKAILRALYELDTRK